MSDLLWISWGVGIFSSLLLVQILRMKKTDPVFGCEKYKRFGCPKVCGRDCDYPECATLKKYRSLTY